MSLGIGTFSASVFIPLFAVGGFIATRRRLSLQWRDELMDTSGDIYPSPSMHDMKFFRRVQPVEDPSTAVHNLSGRPMDRSEHFGVLLLEDLFSPEETQALLEEASEWSSTFGLPMEARVAEHIRNLCDSGAHAAGYLQSLQSSRARQTVSGLLATLKQCGALLSSNRVVSDHAVDCQVMKAPWGSGDSMAMDKLPMGLRWAAKRVQTRCPNIGRLRHVFLEYSPSGMFCRAPSCPPGYDGHEYVVIPLTAMAETPTVVTFSPSMRSRQASSVETLANSWTSRDVDVLVRGGSSLRVTGGARYFWGWGVRPLQWFGACSNSRDALMMVDGDPGGRAGGVRGVPWAPASTLRSIWNTAKEALGGSKGAPCLPRKPAALLVLHFEGPRSGKAQRNKLLHPELLMFGPPPQPESFDVWTEQRPTETDVWDDYVVLFLMKNYFNMLQAA